MMNELFWYASGAWPTGLTYIHSLEIPDERKRTDLKLYDSARIFRRGWHILISDNISSLKLLSTA